MYASNAGNNTVVAYAPSSSTPLIITISDGVNVPTGLVVGGDGTVYVANVGSESVYRVSGGRYGSVVDHYFLSRWKRPPKHLAVDKSNTICTFSIWAATVAAASSKCSPGQTSGTDLDFDCRERRGRRRS